MRKHVLGEYVHPKEYVLFGEATLYKGGCPTSRKDKYPIAKVPNNRDSFSKVHSEKTSVSVDIDIFPLYDGYVYTRLYLYNGDILVASSDKIHLESNIIEAGEAYIELHIPYLKG